MLDGKLEVKRVFKYVITYCTSHIFAGCAAHQKARGRGGEEGKEMLNYVKEIFPEVFNKGQSA